ncbi:unnamed protein product [Ostreobium quekettii]|uniref:ABC transporter domain-containing protein n=1 Tax=Ostreobium quekettii TaxID=121088 RepID=A0A8S1IN44_9CHLO|nr:unnamed protein product [Ostreobium quekettii]
MLMEADGQQGTELGSVSVGIDGEDEDVAAERRTVGRVSETGDSEHVIIVRGLRKVFPSTGGYPKKVAVKDLYMTVRKGEVFGLLGPNGAGKTTAVNMLVGYTTPTSGSALVGGLNIRKSMHLIYDMMGVCPQQNLLWDTLTAAEHLEFYGRLKGLSGDGLKTAVVAALKSVRLFGGDTGKKLVKAYSGGMRRRLSVAISLIGDPSVAYLDEPSTGLDIAARRNLWNTVKRAREGKAIILTTHSMQEAEVLCDRVGFIVNGSLVAIGNPRSLISRHGGYLIFTLTTTKACINTAKEQVSQKLTRNARLAYEVSRTLIFELPTAEVKISEVFFFAENVKSQIQVIDWAVTSATLEQVFMKVVAKAGITAEALH